MRRGWLGFGAVLGLTAVLLPPALAHPVPKRSHDRVIAVRLTPAAVLVEYTLEVDDWTVVFQDLPAVADQVDLSKLSKPDDFYEAFTRCYAPILADNLVATLDGAPLSFACSRRTHQLIDSLRCDFVFRAPLRVTPGAAHTFTFREGNYELESGLIRLSLTADAGVGLASRSQPDAALQARASSDLRPGEDELLRKASATFTVEPAATAAASPPTEEIERGETVASPHSLLGLLLDTRQGIWVLLFLAALFGAAHALTPGHGKTLVAAYLVGERGTVLHALVLGLVTTITHTGSVLILAAGLLLLFPNAVPHDVQMAVGLGGGLLVAGMGLWLLLRRLSGGPDHVHLGGGHPHHHDHGHEHVHAPASARVGWWGLIVLGMSGGIVPCWDAIAMFGFAVSAQRLWLALPLLLAFSAGLAGVLIAIGIGVVYARGFAASRWGDSRLFQRLPLVSAVLVTTLGLWLCYDSVHPEPAPPGSAAGARP